MTDFFFRLLDLLFSCEAGIPTVQCLGTGTSASKFERNGRFLTSLTFKAAKDSSANYDMILDLLEDCRRYLNYVHLQISSNVTEQQKRLAVETLAELLSILAMAKTEIVRGKAGE